MSSYVGSGASAPSTVTILSVQPVIIYGNTLRTYTYSTNVSNASSVSSTYFNPTLGLTSTTSGTGYTQYYNYITQQTGTNFTYTVSAAAPTFAPLGSNVNGIIVRCNLVYNPVNAYTDVLDSFPITATFGSNINYLPISDNWMKVKPGKYSSLIVTFMDQNFNPLLANDPNVLITLLIKLP